MKIIIADDHDLVRTGLKQLIASISSDYQLFEAANSQDVLKHREGDIDLILLDLNMPGVESLTSVAHICSSMPSTAVVIVSGNTASHMIQGCIDAGAMGFIPKSASNQVTKIAIQLVLSGEQYIPYTFLQEAAQAHGDITARQQDVWRLIVDGLSNKAIARELCLTEGTVKQHVSALFKALNVHSRMGAAQKAKEC